MKSAGKVSVIVPVYNAEKYLAKTVASITQQTYPDLEIILVDDGSTDHSTQICDTLARTDARISVIHQPNGGVSRARNAGLKVATGVFVEFVDSDDTLTPDCVATLVAGMAENDLVICGFTKSSKRQHLYTVKREGTFDFREQPAVLFKLLKGKLFNIVWNKLYRRDKITAQFDPRYCIGEDVIFNWEYLNNCQSVRTIAQPLYRYNFTNQSSIMHTKLYDQENFRCYWQDVYRLCARYFRDERYLYFLNGQYVKALMLQIMEESLMNALSYRAYKKVFQKYRNTANLSQVLKHCDKNFLGNDPLGGRMLIFAFRHKLYFPFFCALKLFQFVLYRKHKK